MSADMKDCLVKKEILTHNPMNSVDITVSAESRYETYSSLFAVSECFFYNLGKRRIVLLVIDYLMEFCHIVDKYIKHILFFDNLFFHSVYRHCILIFSSYFRSGFKFFLNCSEEIFKF